MISDVLFLVAVFEKFRATCLGYYELGPISYLSAPSLTWDAMFLRARVGPELVRDLEPLEAFENMKRGGLCFARSKRIVESAFIMYWDDNSLYGAKSARPFCHTRI